MGTQALVQLFMIGVAVVVGFTIIKPTVEAIGTVQGEIQQYNDALTQAQAANAELQRLAERINSVTPAERAALDRFLPATVDPVLILRDVEQMAELNNLFVLALGMGEVAAAQPEPEIQYDDDGEPINLDAIGGVRGALNKLQRVTVNASFEGDYEDLKAVLQDLERNAYILEVTSLSVGLPTETDLEIFTLELQLETYLLPVESVIE